MRELSNPRLMWTKAALFLVAGLLATGGILASAPHLQVAVLLAITVWCFSRAYFFAFYVIEHFIDDSYRFRGLCSLLWYALGRGRRAER